MDGGLTLFRGCDQNHTQEKKNAKVKWQSEEALQIVEKKGKAKGKGERERYTHLNTEFQRIATSDKKAFLRGNAKKQRKTIEWG